MRACLAVFSRAPAAVQVLGIVTVLGAYGCIHPATASAQAIGTLQVEARVTAADFEWTTLQAAQALAERAPRLTDPDSKSRVALPLSQIEVIAPASRIHGEDRPLLIAVQYLRN
jgi:hypothetical protein